MQAVGLDEFFEDLRDKLVSDQNLRKSKIGQAFLLVCNTSSSGQPQS